MCSWKAFCSKRKIKYKEIFSSDPQGEPEERDNGDKEVAQRVKKYRMMEATPYSVSTLSL